MCSRELESKSNLILSATIIFSMMVVYLWLAATKLLGGDSGVFSAVTLSGGYAHAPGYPIYSWLLHTFSFIDPSPVAASSYLTAFIGVCALGTLYGALRAWGVRTEAAWLAAVVFGTFPSVVYFGTQAEVFSLNHLFVSAILWVCAPKFSSKNPYKRCFVLGLLAGLALSHHQTAVFIAPLGVWSALSSCRASKTWSALVAGVGGLLLGLMPYLYLSWVDAARPDSWHWGDPSSLSGLLDLFLRSDYGTFQMTIVKSGEETFSSFSQVMFLIESVGAEFLGVGLIAALAGFYWLGKRHRAEALALAACLLLSGPFFVAMLHRNPEGVDFLLVRKFHLLFELLAAFMLGFAVDAGIRRKALGWVLIALVLGFGVWRSADYVLGMQTDSVESLVSDTWSVVSPDGVVLGSGDHLSMGSELLLLGRESGGQGFFVSPSLLVHSWYRERVNRALNIQTEHTGQVVDLVAFAQAVQRSGRPVWVDGHNAPHLPGLALEPDGLLVRVLPPGQRPRSPLDVGASLEQSYSKFRFRPDEVTQNPWKKICAESYQTNWRVLGDLLTKAGLDEQAKVAERRAAYYKYDHASEHSGKD